MNTINTSIQSIQSYTVRNAADVSEMPSGTMKLPIARTDGKKGKSGLCIVVPELSDNVLQLVMVDQYGKQWLIDCINGVRSGIASAINKAGRTITSDQIGIDSILRAITLEVQNARLSKESIAAWFNSELSHILMDAIKSKLPGISSDKLDRLVDSYRNDFQLLSARELIISKELKSKLEKALALLPDDYIHPVAEKLADKLSESGSAIVEDVL